MVPDKVLGIGDVRKALFANLIPGMKDAEAALAVAEQLCIDHRLGESAKLHAIGIMSVNLGWLPLRRFTRMSRNCNLSVTRVECSLSISGYWLGTQALHLHGWLQHPAQRSKGRFQSLQLQRLRLPNQQRSSAYKEPTLIFSCQNFTKLIL